LERSLELDFARVNLITWSKAARQQLTCDSQSDLPKVAGTWVSGFFLVGLLVGFKNPAVRRLRYFLVSCLVSLIVVQALGRTALSDDSPILTPKTCWVLSRHWSSLRHQLCSFSLGAGRFAFFSNSVTR